MSTGMSSCFGAALGGKLNNRRQAELRGTMERVPMEEINRKFRVPVLPGIQSLATSLQPIVS